MLIMVCLLLFLLMLLGCTGVRTSYSMPVYFDDTGNKVENAKICYQEMEKECAKRPRCDSWQVSILECDEGECYCD